MNDIDMNDIVVPDNGTVDNDSFARETEYMAFEDKLRELIGSASAQELESSRDSVVSAIEEKLDSYKEEGFKGILSIMSTHGFTEKYVISRLQTRIKMEENKEPVSDKKEANGGASKMVYYHPNNNTKTWSGRGRPPMWVTEWTRSNGISAEDLKKQLPMRPA